MKYLLVLAFLIIPTAASAQWGPNRERALDQMQRQHENLQQQQYDLWLQNRGDWSCDPIYGSAVSCGQLQRLPGPRYRHPLRGYYYEDDDD